jgi:hypothetical protein
VNGSLTPTQSGSVSRLWARIIAYPPFGLITTTCSWGFMAGLAPPGTTTLTVAASGTTFERATSQTFAGYASATAEISITVDEFVRLRRPRPRQPPDFVFARSITSGPTPIYNLTNYVAGFEDHIRDGTDATVLVMPITPGRSYQWWINSVQSAGCQAVTGYSSAVSNFAF